MSAIAHVKDGEIVETNASSMSLSKAQEKKNPNGLDKDAFLQLLVAEMQNQDPLQPTTNTEYISQFATFSELEEMQNMSSSVDMSRAQSLVGKEVFLDVTNKNGETTQVVGQVDYVVMENGKVYVSIDDSLYSFDDVTTVLDSDYWEAYNLAYDWTEALAKLSSLNDLTLSDRTDVEALRKAYDNMDDYQKSFIAGDSVNALKAYENKLEELNTLAKNDAEQKDAESETAQEGASE